MNIQEAEKNKWRCPHCGEPLEVSRGAIYYCPNVNCIVNKPIKEAMDEIESKKA